MSGIYAVLLAMYVFYIAVNMKGASLSLVGALTLVSWLIGIASIVLQFLL